MSNDERNEGIRAEIDIKRDFMKCPDFSKKMTDSDQQKKLPQPSLSLEKTGAAIELNSDFDSALRTISYTDLLDIRRSERVYDSSAQMTQNQLAFMLWSSQGIQKISGNNYATFRPVPSGGARHPFETYIIVRSVEGLEPGLYRYLPLEHAGEKRVSVEFVKNINDHDNCVSKMLAGQKFAAAAGAVLFLTCVAYRAEWRYSVMAHRVVLIDQGHVGQNWMLSASAMGLGSCCFAAFDQNSCDEVLGIDGYEQYTVYACSVGAVQQLP